MPMSIPGWPPPNWVVIDPCAGHDDQSGVCGAAGRGARESTSARSRASTAPRRVAANHEFAGLSISTLPRVEALFVFLVLLAGPPPPGSPIPRDPARLAARLEQTTRDLDDAIDVWRASGA